MAEEGIQAKKQYKKMTETPVEKLVLSLGLPTTVSMLVTSIYNLADTYFVSELGISESGAIGVVFAIMAIIQAFGFMYGHGAGSNIGRALGGQKIDEAKMFSSTGFYMSLLTGILICIFGLTFQTKLMYLCGSTDTILPHAMEYSRFILLAAPFMTISCVMNNILRYEGKAVFSMFGLVLGGLLNILGDFLLIKVYGLGVAGAGISTAVSQMISTFVLMLPFIRGKVQSSLNIKYASFDLSTIAVVIAVGLPSLIRQGLNSLSSGVLNNCSKPYGDSAIAAMSVVTRVIGFMFSVGLGIGQGFQPVCGFNYGAKKYKRVKDAYWFTLRFGTMLLCIFAFFGIFYSNRIIMIFREEPEVVEIGSVALRMQSIALLFVPVTVTANMLFQSVGKSSVASLLASIRSGVIFIPVILILKALLGITGIEISQAISDVISAFIAFPIAFNFLRKLPKEDSGVENKIIGG